MNNTKLVGLVAVVALLAGVVGGYVVNKLGAAPLVGGDFAGGITPSSLVTASASGGLTGNGYVAPIGSLSSAAVNGLTIGGTDQYHGLTAYVTASGTPTSVATLGAFGATTSSASTTITIPETAGLSVNAICSGNAATTTVFVSGCILTSTNGVTGTAQVYYSNGTPSSLSVPTSTVFRISFDQLPY
jgi:hypothetical protein